MRTLGLIGGTTWHWTVDSCRLINRGAQKRLRGNGAAAMVMVSAGIAPVRALPLSR